MSFLSINVFKSHMSMKYVFPLINVFKSHMGMKYVFPAHKCI